jgi:protein O-GlcNAc transferase
MGRQHQNNSEDLKRFAKLSVIYNRKKKYALALDYAQKGLNYDSRNSILLNNLGNSLKGLGQWDAAITAYKKFIAIDPNEPVGYLNLGSLLQKLGRVSEALDCYEKAVALDSKNPKIHNNLGIIYRLLGKYSDAIICYQTSIRLNPQDAFPYHNMGNIYLDLTQWTKAMRCFEKAISLDPKLYEAYISLGIVNKNCGNRQVAIDCFLKAIKITPDNPRAYPYLVRALQYECRWKELNQYKEFLNKFTQLSLEKGQKPEEVPFQNLSRQVDPFTNFRVAKAWSDNLVERIQAERKVVKTLYCNNRKTTNKITIAYLSNNFKNHPTAHLISGLFKLHNREKFNVHCYSYGPDDGSVYRRQIEKDSDFFLDIIESSHLDAAKKIIENKVDILIDLVGQMLSCRLEIAALKVAPIQVRWLGMAGTSGSDFFDYIITDSIVTPEDQTKYYSETFAYMPHTYQINNSDQIVSDRTVRRKDVCLPEDAFVYACFCSTYKIEPMIYEVWMSILDTVPNSVLWLLSPGKSAEDRLKNEAKNSGISPERILFAEKVDRSEHLVRIGLSDLCLDTHIVNGAATTSEALWCGVPVITTMGRHFASRMAASILSAMALPELVTDTLGDYKKLAIRLADDRNFYCSTRQKVVNGRNNAPLFNTPNFVKGLEDLFQQMWNCYQKGEQRKIIRAISSIP